jgi:hypothetical protein
LRSFRVGDISLEGPEGQDLPYAAVARGDSYLVGKTNAIALKSCQELNVHVKPDEEVEMTYCFILPPHSGNVRLHFQKARTDFVIEYDKMPGDEKKPSS